MQYLKSILKHIILLTLVVLAFTTCAKKNDTKVRSFYMGTTPWPADFTAADVDTAYRFLNEHCDIISQHFDDGIPYEEILSGTPWPDKMWIDINFRASRSIGKNVLLSISALDLTRKAKADYYQASTQDASIKAIWKNRAFDDSLVILTYIKYVEELIRKFKPVMLNYAVESNLLTWEPDAFNRYKKFLSAVYSKLKSNHPELPIFLSVMVDESNAALQNAAALMNWTDYLAFSSYPYLTVSSSNGGNTNPDLFPANYYNRFIDIAPNKPLAFAETGYIAEDLILPTAGISKNGNVDWQKKYLQNVLELCERKNAVLFIWFCSKDYDNGIETIKNNGLYQELFSFWRDIGFYDQLGQKRPSLSLWDDWFKRTRVKK